MLNVLYCDPEYMDPEYMEGHAYIKSGSTLLNAHKL